MTTKEMIAIAKTKGISIRKLSKMTNISESTIYHFNCGISKLSREKEEKIRDTLVFLLDYDD